MRVLQSGLRFSVLSYIFVNDDGADLTFDFKAGDANAEPTFFPRTVGCIFDLKRVSQQRQDIVNTLSPNGGFRSFNTAGRFTDRQVIRTYAVCQAVKIVLCCKGSPRGV